MIRNSNPLVCFFDSGIGGINLLYESVKILPNTDFAYFADNYNVPYGNFSHEELILRVDEIFSRMEKLNPSAAVLACNTVTAHCVGYLRKKYPFEIIGIQPAVKPASKNGKCVVLTTPATCNSNSLKDLIEEYGNERAQVVPCPNLASYIEENIFDLSEERIRNMLPAVKTDGIVLGCTHYIFAEEIIANYYGCEVYDGIAGTAKHLREKLGNFDHFPKRAQKIDFLGGDARKNSRIFKSLLLQNGLSSPKG